MRLTLAEPKYLKDSLSIIADLVTEVRLKVTQNSLELVAMDPANVAMVIYKLLASSFTEFAIEEEVNFGINLSNLKQILKRVSQGDVLTLELEESKLSINIKGVATRTFSIPLLDMEDRNQKVPELNFPAEVTLSSGMLNDAIEDEGIVAESVALMIENDKFIVSAEGDLSKAKIEISSDETTNIINDTGDRIKAKYSIEYLKKMISASKLSDVVSIKFNNDYPLKIEYKVVDKMLLAFILAPRVEND